MRKISFTFIIVGIIIPTIISCKKNEDLKNPPNSTFSANLNDISFGESVTFKDLSTENPSSWSWSFPGGTPSTSSEQNPTVVYNTIGVYNVTLTVSNPKGNNSYTATNFIRVNPKLTFYSHPFELQSSNIEITDMKIDDNGNVWVATNSSTSHQGLFKFDGSNWVNYTTSNSSLPSNIISCIAIENQNKIWIGTDKGLVKFDGSNFTVFDTLNCNILSNWVEAIVVDANGRKWIGTRSYYVSSSINYLGGLSMFDDVTWVNYNSQNSSFTFDNVSDLNIDSYGNKWMVAYYGLCKFDGTTFTEYYNSTYSLGKFKIDKQDNLWVLSSGVLLKFKNGNWTVYDKNTPGFIYSSEVQGAQAYATSLIVDNQNMKWFIPSIYFTDGGSAYIGTIDNNNMFSSYHLTKGVLSSYLEGHICNHAPIAIDSFGNKWFFTGANLIKMNEIN